MVSSVAFKPPGEVQRPTPFNYLISNAQLLLALEQSRIGDLRLELDVRGFLPQTAGFPGAPAVTESISVAESRGGASSSPAWAARSAWT